MNQRVTSTLTSSVLLLLATASVPAAVLLDLSPPGTSAGRGLSPLNEFLAGAEGLGGAGSGGTVGAGLRFDPASRTLSVQVGYGSVAGFSDLTGPAFAWLLHGPASPDRAGPVMLDLATLHRFGGNPAEGGFLEGAVRLTEPQADALLGGFTYLNIYTTTFPGGEIRGQLVVVPEPAGWAYMFLPLGFLGWAIQRRTRGARRSCGTTRGHLT